MLRTSSYVIYVDLPGRPDESIVVHGYTGSIDKVSGRVAAFLKSRDGAHKHRVQEEVDASCIDDESMQMLRRRGYLTELAEADEVMRLGESVNQLHNMMAARMPNYLFMPSYDCNLRCFYCFQDEMRTDPAHQRLLSTMSTEVVDRIFSAMPKLEKLHGVDAQEQVRSIGFFGGEPLLDKSLPVVEYIIEKALSLGKAKFWAVTNGTNLESCSHLLGPERIQHIQITLDGIPEEHDKRRIYPDGRGTFARIADNIDLALGKKVLVQVRVNVDANNISDLPRLARIAVERGWDKCETFDIHAAAISTCDKTTNKLSRISTWKLRGMIDKLAAEHAEMEVFRRPDAALKSKMRQIFNKETDAWSIAKSSFCSAHDRMYVFDAFADIYACWERTGDANIRIGRVLESGELESNKDVLRMWRTRTASSNPVCRKCRYLLYCGGGCAVLAETAHGEFFSNYCDDFAKRFQSGVAEAYASCRSAGQSKKIVASETCN